MPKPRRATLKNKTIRLPSGLEARLEQRAEEEHSSVNRVVVQLLERGLPRAAPFGRVRALGDRIAQQRRPAQGPPPRFTKDELHEDEG